MAKKTAAKKAASKQSAASKSAPKPAAGKPGKTAKKASTKKADAKAKGKPKAKKQPYMTTAGKGATTAELGNKLVTMVKSQTPEHQIWAELFHKKFESIEGDGSTWSGFKGVGKKCDEWMSQHTIHGFKVEGPFVGATSFGVRYEMDVEVKATGHRMNFTEIGVYTVKNGKVVREEFMYAGM